ncbi:hypothetical protein, partial [Mesorhizobium sp.]|uniref:hypothetical protein n=1 Tax=Mesorhizobium sp. TaxID=1871066 RepID=UPI0025D5C311
MGKASSPSAAPASEHFCELQVPIIAASGPAFVAIDDLEHFPMKAGLARPEPPHGTISGRSALFVEFNG